MAVIMPYEGRDYYLTTLITAVATFELRLFKNNITPDIDTEYADFTECDFSGYSSINLTLGGVARDGDDNARSTALLAQFAHNGGGTANDVYGWYLIPNGGTVVFFAERFSDAPRVMDTLGDEINITPALTQGACP